MISYCVSLPNYICSGCGSINEVDRFVRDCVDFIGEESSVESIVKCKKCGHEKIDTTYYWSKTEDGFHHFHMPDPNKPITF